jgi:orotate phosphoribosyltransferase
MRSDSPLQCLRRLCSRHIFERDADWQYGLDGDIQTRLFVDLMEAAHVDATLAELSRLMAGFVQDRISEPVGFVAGPKRGNALLIRETARRLGRHSAFVKQQPLFDRWIEGPIDPGSPALVVDDVASDGELLLSVVDRLRDQGHRVIAAIVLIDRDEGNSGLILREHSVDFHYMMSASDDDLRRIRAEAARGFDEDRGGQVGPPVDR